MDAYIWQIVKWPAWIAAVVIVQLSGVAIHHIFQQQKLLEPMCVVEQVTYNDSVRSK